MSAEHFTAACGVQIRHVGGTGRGQMAQVGGLGADLIEQLQVDGHTGRVSDGQQVQHGDVYKRQQQHRRGGRALPQPAVLVGIIGAVSAQYAQVVVCLLYTSRCV